MGTGDLGLRDKVALVTGSVSGIGEAIARRLGAEGAKVLIHGRPEQQADGERIAREISASGVEAAVRMADIEDPAACEELVTATVERFGGRHFCSHKAHLLVDEQIESLRGVRQLLAGGDALSASHVRQMSKVLGNNRLINGYGPTEAT